MELCNSPGLSWPCAPLQGTSLTVTPAGLPLTVRSRLFNVRQASICRLVAEWPGLPPLQIVA